MTEPEYKSLINFGWDERDIKGRLIRDQIEHIEYDFLKHIDRAVSDAKQIYGSKDGQFIVYDFTLDTHNPDGYHPKGRAIDGAFRGLDLFETFLIFDWWRFGGIGIYPGTLPDKIVHVDDRDSRRASRWVRTENTYVYTPIYFKKALMTEGLSNDE